MLQKLSEEVTSNCVILQFVSSVLQLQKGHAELHVCDSLAPRLRFSTLAAAL